jgi:hypothetical protein
MNEIFQKSNDKGNLGELAVIKYIQQKEYNVFKPTKPIVSEDEILFDFKKTDESHAFDGIAIKYKNCDNPDMFLYDVKTKAKRNNYDDTGLNLKHFNLYKKISKEFHLKFMLFFVDELSGICYANWIDKLEINSVLNGKEYPSIESTSNGIDIIYFPICSMIELFTITDELCKEIKNKNQRKYEYLS